MNKIMKCKKSNGGHEVWYGNDKVCAIVILDKGNNIVDIDNASDEVVSDEILISLANEYVNDLRDIESHNSALNTAWNNIKSTNDSYYLEDDVETVDQALKDYQELMVYSKRSTC